MTATTKEAQDVLQKAEILVIKVGSVLITDEDRDTMRQTWLDSLAEEVQELIAQGKKVAIVTSGGIALGRRALDIPHNMAPSDIRLDQKQAASSVGQFYLFHAYFRAFDKLNMNVGQVLLTMSETENRRMHLNARETLATLMERRIIPIINENDVVSTGEIRFGDNDRLAARVAQMIGAGCIILLSTIDGFYTADPHKDPDAEYLPVIEKITPEHISMGDVAKAGLSTGGMRSKLEAAQIATKAGIPLIVADGTHNYPISDILNGTKKTTIFLAADTKENARKKWIRAHISPKGRFVVDSGAAQALKDGKSLLPIGVKESYGDYERGDAVSIISEHGVQIGVGLSAYSAEDTAKIIGHKSEEIVKLLGYLGRNELIHRNDMVLD